VSRRVRWFVALGLWVALAAGCARAGAADASASPGANPKLLFWVSQRKGANCQNTTVGPDYWEAAKAAGIEFIRLAPDGWMSAGRDFLIGDADSFQALDASDLEALRAVLDDADAAGVRVVLTMFSLPGARWRQLNEDRDDARLWIEPGYREQALLFWRELAASLRDHPAVVAYNPLNEPHPERAFGLIDPDDATFAEWFGRIRGTEADLNAFNRAIVAAIREVDPETPIILDGWCHASAAGLTRLEPVADDAVLYAFHYYEPWDYTTYRANSDRYIYPTRMPPGWAEADMERDAGQVASWAERNGIPADRIIVSEFGVDRRVGGAAQYLEGLVALFNGRGWHWAFYAFRQDGDWGGLDYELGAKPLGDEYWKAIERGEAPESLKHRGPNPLWDVLSRALLSP
jgi:endoglucanase